MKPIARLVSVSAAGSLLAALTGCSGMYATSIATPANLPAPPAGAPAVNLVVADERLPNEGGSDPRRVGTIRALAGNGAGMREESPDAVRRLVEAATANGLAKAGVSATAGAALEVGIRKFWMDGYASYTAELHGDLVLKKGGAEAWRKSLKVSAAGEQGGGSPSEMFNRVWGWALERWRDRVAEVAAEPEFLAALGARGALAAAPSADGPKAASNGPVGLSVTSEFRIDDRQRVWFEMEARRALKEARLDEKRGAFPEIAVRYVSVYEENSRKMVTGYRVTTRCALKDASGRIHWEESFDVKDAFAEIDPKNTGSLQTTFNQSLERNWTPQLLRRLQSPAFRKAAGR